MSTTRSASAATLGLVAESSKASPVGQLIPFITETVSLFSSFLRFFASLLRPLTFLSPLPVLLYVFAPLVVFLNITATLFIRSPYWTLTYLLDALYPLYVFCGVACITGLVLGVAGRFLCKILITVVEMEEEQAPVKIEEKQQAVQEKTRRSRERVKFAS